jgi:hypothetical protein
VNWHYKQEIWSRILVLLPAACYPSYVSSRSLFRASS